MSSRSVVGIVLSAMVFLLPFCITNVSYAEDVYSLFGKLFLSGRVEYDFTDTRDFLADTEVQSVEQEQLNRTTLKLHPLPLLVGDPVEVI